MGQLSITALDVIHAEVRKGAKLEGKYCVVTGASSGIGLETARALAMAGVHVVMACRDVEKGLKCVEEMNLTTTPNQNLAVMELKLESFQSIRMFALAYLAKGWPLHYLVCNAGIFPLSWTMTENGNENAFQVCHLGHYLLFRLLQGLLLASAPSRVVMVSSMAYPYAPKWDWPDGDHKGFGADSGPWQCPNARNAS